MFKLVRPQRQRHQNHVVAGVIAGCAPPGIIENPRDAGGKGVARRRQRLLPLIWHTPVRDDGIHQAGVIGDAGGVGEGGNFVAPGRES